MIEQSPHGWGIGILAGKRTFKPEAETLRELYQTMTIRELAVHFNIGDTVVHKRLHEYGIKLTADQRKRKRKQFTEAHKQALSDSMVRGGTRVGDRNPNWQGGITGHNLRIRGTIAYKRWRIESLERTGYLCEDCGAKEGTVCECCGHRTKLHIHHIDSFAKNVERRFDPTNSEVLCPKCHFSRHRAQIG